MSFDPISAGFSFAEKIVGLFDSGDDRTKRAEMTMEVQKVLTDYSSQVLDAQKSIIVAEANSDSWITRSWRPLTMLWLLGLITICVIAALFGAPDLMAQAFAAIPVELWDLLKIGLGGYIAGRSVEKIAKTSVSPFSKK